MNAGRSHTVGFLEGDVGSSATARIGDVMSWRIPSRLANVGLDTPDSIRDPFCGDISDRFARTPAVLGSGGRTTHRPLSHRKPVWQLPAIALTPRSYFSVTAKRLIIVAWGQAPPPRHPRSDTARNVSFGLRLGFCKLAEGCAKRDPDLRN